MTSAHVPQVLDFLKGKLTLRDVRKAAYSDGVRAMIAKTIIVAHPQATLQGDNGTTYHVPHSIDALLQAIYPKRMGEAKVDLGRLKKLLVETDFVVEVGDEILVYESIGFVQMVATYQRLRVGGLAVFYTQPHPKIGIAQP